MGRRSRARERAAASAVAPPGPATPARAQGGRPSRLRLLNPFRPRRLTPARTRSGAIGFGLAALLFAVLGWLTGQAAWFNSAVLLAVLALVWGATAVLMGRADRSS